jgi:uncharacterized protein (TIGR02266 family)
MAVAYTAGEESFRCVAYNLGGGGLFLAHVEGLEPGKEISVRFRPAKHLPVIQAKASVRHLIAGQGAGIEFTEISADDRQRLLRLIHLKTGDRRLQRRGPLATQVQCEQCMTLAFSRDISPGGMFIETTVPLPVGTLLTVRFNLNNKDRVVTATAQVAYQVEKMGMGILFTEIDPEDRDAIQEYVKSVAVPPKSGSATSKST